jgi:hypothetical protein
MVPLLCLYVDPADEKHLSSAAIAEDAQSAAIGSAETFGSVLGMVSGTIPLVYAALNMAHYH